MPELTKVSAALAALVLVSCGGENAYVAPPPPEVDAQPPLVQPLTVYDEFPGRTEPFKRYEVRTRVTGFLEKKHFEEGGYVEKGNELFTIEKVQFEAAKKKAEGDLAQADASLSLAQSTLAKKESVTAGAVSKLEIEESRAQVAVAEANVKIAQAALDKATEDLNYCDISSAISGRVSRAAVDAGNLVSGTQATLLATVVQDDPIYVTIEVNEREILEHLTNRPSADRAEISAEARAVELRLYKSNGEPYGQIGQWHSLDNELDSGTGTIEVTARFPNPDRELAAGLSVRLGVPEEIPEAVLIPAAAIQRDMRGTYVFVVGEDKKAERRDIELSDYSEGSLAVIDGGLSGSDRVIVSNLQRIRQGVAVSPTEIPPPTSPAEGKPEASATASAAEQG